MNRKLIISLGIIAVLVLYLLLVKSDRPSSRVPDVDQWEGECTEIVIDKKSEEKIRIYKKEGKWVLGEEAFPADITRVEKMITSMKELEITDFISDGPYYEKYDLTPGRAFRVTVKEDSKILRDVLIGKKSSTNRNTYIKFPEKKEIYLSSGNLVSDFDQEIADLRDKEIYNIDKDAVESLELVYNGKKLTFTKQVVEVKDEAAKEGEEAEVKKEEKWVCKEYKSLELSSNKVESLVNSFRTIKASSFPDIKKDAMRSSVCTLKGRAYNKDIILTIHKQDDEKNYLCTSSESPYVFTLREYNVKKFFKGISDFTEDKKKK